MPWATRDLFRSPSVSRNTRFNYVPNTSEMNVVAYREQRAVRLVYSLNCPEHLVQLRGR